MAGPYEFWDKAMSTRNPDYATISHQMAAISRSMVSADSELLWRLSQATFGHTFHMDWFHERDLIRAKTQEARVYAERAIKANAESFGAHLWLAKCIGQLILLETNKFAALSMVGLLRHHLEQAIAMDPGNWRVLLLEAQMQVGLHEHANALKDHTGRLPEAIGELQELPIVEAKLRRVLEMNPHSHEAIFALSIVLYLQHKFAEAQEVCKVGLGLNCVNKGEEYVARMLESFMPDIARKVSQGHS